MYKKRQTNEDTKGVKLATKRKKERQTERERERKKKSKIEKEN